MGGRGKSGSEMSAGAMQGGEKKHCHRCRNECGKDFMHCRLCDSCFHVKCENVTAQQLSLFRQLDQLKAPYEWLCSSCRKTDVMNIVKTLQAMQSKIDRLEKEVDSLKQKRMPSTSQKSDSPAANRSDNHDVSEAVNEALDIERRKLNLVVTGLPQSEEKTDGQLIQGLLEDPVLEITGTVLVIDVQRIGKKGHVLLTFDNLDNKRIILRSAYKLRTSTISSHRSIYIAPDLTRRQRQIEFELRQELRSRREQGEVGLRISKGKIVKIAAQEASQGTNHAAREVSTPQVVWLTPNNSSGQKNGGTPTSRQGAPHVIQVVRGGTSRNSAIPRPSTSCGGGGGSAAPAGVAGSQGKN